MALRERLLLALGDREAVRVPVLEREEVLVALGDLDTEGVAETLFEIDGDLEGVRELEGVSEIVLLCETVALSVSDELTLLLAVREGVGVPLGVRDSEIVGELVSEPVNEELGDSLGAGVSEGVGVSEMVVEGVRLGVVDVVAERDSDSVADPL